MTQTTDKLFSTVEAAILGKASRERVVRLIQLGRVEGRLIAGRWFLTENGLAQLQELSAAAGRVAA